MRWFKKDKKAKVSVDPLSAKYVTITELYLAITKASLFSTDSLKKSQADATISRKLSDTLTHQKVTMEFFYFYAHLMDRAALSQLGDSRRNTLVDLIVEFGLDPLIKAMFPDSDVSWRAKVVSETLANFNNAQEEYASATEFIAEDLMDLTKEQPQALVSRLYCNLKRALDYDHPMLYLAVVTTVTEQMQAMNLKEKLTQGAKFLPGGC
jgi:hypothetical protein